MKYNNPRDYVDYITGHFLNSLDYNVERIESLIEKQSEKWLHWNQNVVGSKDPVVLPEEQYQVMKGFFNKVGRELARLDKMMSTTLKLLLEIDIEEYTEDLILVKTARIKKAFQENGWHYGRTLWTNLKALLDLLKLHLAKLRSKYNEIIDDAVDKSLVLEWQLALKTHCQSMQGLIKNVLFTLDSRLEEVIKEFKDF
mgnify:CR=1 FL=1|jgi:hypothetical protein